MTALTGNDCLRRIVSLEIGSGDGLLTYDSNTPLLDFAGNVERHLARARR